MKTDSFYQEAPVTRSLPIYGLDLERMEILGGLSGAGGRTGLSLSLI